MPYYIYRITQIGPIRQIEKTAQFDAFRDASAEAKRLRMAADPAQGQFKVIFGENELQAEDILNTVRPPEPLLGDDI